MCCLYYNHEKSTQQNCFLTVQFLYFRKLTVEPAPHFVKLMITAVPDSVRTILLYLQWPFWLKNDGEGLQFLLNDMDDQIGWIPPTSFGEFQGVFSRWSFLQIRYFLSCKLIFIRMTIYEIAVFLIIWKANKIILEVFR